MSTNANIHSLNFHFLMVLHDLALRDVAVACQAFGVSLEVAHQVRDMPLDDLKRLSECDHPYMRSTLSAAVLERLKELPPSARPAFMTIIDGVAT